MNVLGYTLDRKGTWKPHIDRITTEARQRLGAIRRLRKYLDDNDTHTAYSAFIRPKLEYGNLVYWSAAETTLNKLDRVQQQAHKLFSQHSISSLEQRREVAAVGLTCKLLHGDTKAPLQSLIPKFEDPNKNKPRRSARLASIKPHNHQLQSCINVNSLEIYKRSYRGRIPEIWNKLNSESLRDEHPHWKDCRRLLQKEMKKQH